MKTKKLTLYLLMLAAALSACAPGQLSDSEFDTQEQDLQRQEPAPKLGGTEVTSPYLRKVVGNIRSEKDSCPFTGATATSQTDQEVHALKLNGCLLEGQLPTGQTYQFDAYDNDVRIPLFFDKERPHLFVAAKEQPLIVDFYLTVEELIEAVSGDILEAAKFEQAKEDARREEIDGLLENASKYNKSMSPKPDQKLFEPKLKITPQIEPVKTIDLTR